MAIIIGILIVGIMMGIALAAKANWHGNMGYDAGQRRMKEYGLDDEKKEYRE